MIVRILRLFAVFAVAQLVSAVAYGQVVVRGGQDDSGNALDVLQLWEMTLTPRAEPVPALKYSLRPRYWERKPGDATPHYYRALLMEAGLPAKLRSELVERYEKWPGNKLDDATKKEIASLLSQYSAVIAELEQATYRERLDLDLRFRDLRGMDAISFLLPDAQATRQLARILSIKARLEIAEGKVDEAIHTLTMGYRLAQAAARSPTMITALIGMSITNVMNEELARLIASPHAPNMYWAIAMIPRPVINLREATEHEDGIPLQIFEFLADAETAYRAPDEWRRLLVEAYMNLHQLSGDYSGKPGEMTELAAVGLIMKSYSQAKKQLIQGGMDAERVEAMPVGQVIAVYTARTQRYLYDEMLKWTFLPPHQVHDRWEEVLARLRQQGLYGADSPSLEALPIAHILMPGYQNVLYASVRVDRVLAALQTIEAIRWYAAEHSGELPETLDDIKQAVVPLDPLYNKPFTYHREGKTGVLDLPARPRWESRQDAFRFVLRIQDPPKE